MQRKAEVTINQRVNLLKLSLGFLKIGSVSFGGYMSLVSMLEDDLVQRKAWVDEGRIVEAIAIASMLPGPLAVNISTYIGYTLKGWLGGLAAMIAVLLPSFVLITVLTRLYLENIEIPWVSSFFLGVMPVIVAIIMKVGLGMWKKTVSNHYQYLLVVLSVVSSLMIKGIAGILIAMIISGLVSYIIETDFLRNRPISSSQPSVDLRSSNVLVPALILLIGLITIRTVHFDSVYWQMANVFATMSVTLFGGGYVFIPMMQEVIVDQNHWLSNSEFIDAIAMGQITPGPILISAAFVGFKLKGILGAAVATVSIFLPAGIIMLLVGQLYKGIADNPHVSLVFKGIKSAIVGLILFSAITIVFNSDEPLYVALLGLVSLGILMKFNLNPILLILLSGMLGIFAL